MKYWNVIAVFPVWMALLCGGGLSAEEVVVVKPGQEPRVSWTGNPFVLQDGAWVGEGVGSQMQLKQAPGSGDFVLTARLTLARIDGSAASLVFNGDSHFGFDSKSRKLFVEGPLFGDAVEQLHPSRDFLKAGRSFALAVMRQGGQLQIMLDQKVVLTRAIQGPVNSLALRPHRNQLCVEELRMRADKMTRIPQPAAQIDVFVSGQDDYKSYRIPALIQAADGSLLAFCEGRRNGGSDTGDIDTVLKRSTDQGQTWGPLSVVWDDEGNTCGNPAPVLDRKTGTLWLLSTWNDGRDHESRIKAKTSLDTRRVYVCSSQDHGKTWTQPREITATTKLPNWTWYATGPCHGIQLTRGAHAGRLVIPCDHIEGDTGHYYSHAIYSDDHGKTWLLGGRTPQHQVNECTVVERAEGQLLLNMRNYDRRQRSRQIALSDDGGGTWHSQAHDPVLIEPICQASLERWSWPTDGKPGRILFANPASEKGRSRMTVRVSYDEGQTWPIEKLIYPGGSAYSDLVRITDREAGLLFEADGYRRISYVALNPEMLGEE